MMRNAAALVVGIDQYDEKGIPVLSGSVYDARIAVAWLLKIGVPPERIHLHVSPLPAQPDSFSGVLAYSARLDAILGSLEALSKDKGDQLFLFLSGHGLNVPGAAGGPIFLAQDYGSGLASSQKNMRMNGFIQWILSWPFRDQFLFYDACQNPSTSVGRVSLVKAVDPPMLDALPVAVTNGMLACFSASPGQTAWAGTGEGVLIRHVLNELDPDALARMPPDAQQQDSVMYNWFTGSRRLDLRRLFGTIVGPAVTEEAADAGNAQTPLCLPYGTAAAMPYSPILDLPDEPTVDLTIHLLPPEAIAAVKALRLSIQTPARNAFLPGAGQKLANPLVCKGPVAAEVVAFCSPKPGSGWRTLESPQTAVLGDQPATMTFNFDMPPPADPPGPLDMYNIRVTGPDGSPRFPLGGAYENIAASSGLNIDLGKGVTFHHHENGPDIAFDASILGAPERAARSATDWLAAIRRHISDPDMSATLFPPGTDPDGKPPNIRFHLAEGGATGLAGFLSGSQSVEIEAVGDEGPASFLSLAEIEHHPLERVEPGPQRVTIDLPWGRWSRLIYPKDIGDPVVCELPQRIGREPLRNVWLRSTVDESPPAISSLVARRMASWLPGAISMLGQSVDDDDCIEPFSRTALPEWDLLFSAGRLDAVGGKRIEELARGAPGDLAGEEYGLLMLGLGHAALNQGDFRALSAALGAVDGLFKTGWDYALLESRLLAEQKRRGITARASHFRRLGYEWDHSFAPQIVLQWTARLLAGLYLDAEALSPNWISRLAPNSIIAVRTRADAHLEDEPSHRSAKRAKQERGKGSAAQPAAENAPVQNIYGEVHSRALRRRPVAEPAPVEIDIDRLDDESEGHMEA